MRYQRWNVRLASLVSGWKSRRAAVGIRALGARLVVEQLERRDVPAVLINNGIPAGTPGQFAFEAGNGGESTLRHKARGGDRHPRPRSFFAVSTGQSHGKRNRTNNPRYREWVACDDGKPRHVG